MSENRIYKCSYIWKKSKQLYNDGNQINNFKGYEYIKDIKDVHVLFMSLEEISFVHTQPLNGACCVVSPMFWFALFSGLSYAALWWLWLRNKNK